MGLGFHAEDGMPENDEEAEKRKLKTNEEEIELKKITVKDSEYPEIITQKSKRLLKTNHLKYALLFFNFILSLLGLVILVLAVWVRSDPEFGEYDSKLVIQEYYTACYMFMVAGFIILIVAFLGCCGAVTETQWMLMAYVITFGIIFIVETAAVIIIWSAPHSKTIRTQMETQIKLQIERREKEESARFFMDFLQANLECCGSTGQKDYYADIPNSCEDEVTGSVHNMGCATLMLNYLQKKAGMIGGIAVPILLFQLLALILSSCLIYNIKRESRYSI